MMNLFNRAPRAVNGSPIDGSVIGATTPAAGTFTSLTTTGNNILGNAQADTLNVGNGDIVKDASGNTGFGITSPSVRMHSRGALYAATFGGNNLNANIFSEDTANQALGVGSGISFGGKYTDAGDYTQWAFIQGFKTDATTGNANGGLRFVTRNSTFAEAARFTNAGRFLLGTTTDDGANLGQIAGNLALVTAGNRLKVKEGANACLGVATLVAGTATVSTTAVGATSRILLTNNATGGTPGFLGISARTPGTSFTILSSNAADTSTVAWMIVDPAC